MSNEQNTLSPAHIEDGEEVEVVGWRISSEGFGSYLADSALHACPDDTRERLMTVAQHKRIVADLKANLAMAMDAAAKGDVARQQCGGMEMEIAELRAALSAPPAVVDRDAIHLAFEHKLREVNLPSYGEHRGDWRRLSREETADVVIELLQSVSAAPPAAGVPEGWKLIPAQPNEAMLNQVSPISGKEERLPYWWYQALIKSAPTPPASEQQRAVVMPEQKRYPDPDGFPSGPDWWARRHAEAKGWNNCLAEFLRLNPHLSKGEGV